LYYQGRESTGVRRERKGCKVGNQGRKRAGRICGAGRRGPNKGNGKKEITGEEGVLQVFHRRPQVFIVAILFEAEKGSGREILMKGFLISAESCWG
jgi:hypothetical protein